MAIKISDNFITLETNNTAYSFEIMHGKYPIHHFYGAKGGNYKVEFPKPQTEFCPLYIEHRLDYSPAMLPNEFSFFGSGDFRAAALKIRNMTNGSDVTLFTYKTFYVNTYMNMLNSLLSERSLPTITAGIGMSTAQELVVKAGRKDVGINNKVWIGTAVSRASNLSSLGNKNGLSPIVYSNLSYSNFIDKLVENNKNKSPKEWFHEHFDNTNKTYYSADIIKLDFNSWINEGMPE